MEDVIYVSKLKPMYFSRRAKAWKVCEFWEVPLYKKYGYNINYTNGGLTKDYLL